MPALALLALILAAPPAATGGPTCKAETIAVVDKALRPMRPDRQHSFALRGVAEACALPAGLDQGARELQSVPPDMRAMIEMKSITASLPQWMAACPGGIETLQKMAQLAPTTRTLALWTQCKLDRFKVPLKAIGAGNSLSPMGLVLAHLVHTWNPKVSPRLIKALLIAPR